MPSGSSSPGGGTNAPVLLQWGKVITTEPNAQAASRALRASPNPAPVQRLSARGTVPWLVQFNDVIREEWKTAMESTGAQLKGYIPENAFLVEASPAQIAAIGRMAEVQWVGEYLPEYKKAGAVRGRMSESPGETSEYNLILLDPNDAQRLAAQVGGIPGAEVVKSGPMADRGLIQAKLTPAAVREAATLGEVEWIEPHLEPQLWNNVAAGSSRMDVGNVWTNLGLTGQGQTVAVLDSGMDTGNTATIHPDFAGRVTGFGWRNGAYNATNSWADLDGHGTHVAGSVLGSGAASTNTFRGIAYQANLIVQGAQTNLSGIALDWRPILQQAFTNGARIHNNSWGVNDFGAYHSLARNLDIYMWTNRTMVVLVAAGNSGTDANADGVIDPTSIGSPASAKNCITVGAAENFRSSGGLAGRTWGNTWPSAYPANPIRDDRISLPETPQGMAAFSSRGPLLDGRIKPDIVAPGTDIISTRSTQTSKNGWGTHPNTNYVYYGGTSMASPLVAGAAALTRQWLIESNGMTNPSASLVKAVLLNGARNMAPGQYGTGATQEIPTQRPNNVTGWGHVDLYKSLVALTNSVRHLHDSGSLATGQTQTYSYSIGAATTNKFIITMAYTDYFPAIGAGKQLVNDLDLTVIKPSGAVVYANGGDELDSTNNVETIEFVPDEIGDYTVRVNARTVPQGSSQPYSLVIVAPLTVVPVITSSSTATGELGELFSYQITAEHEPFSFGASGLPPGLSVNTTTGLISGSPTTAGTYNATITATNAVGTGEAALAITINRVPEAVFAEDMGSAPTTTAIANHSFQNSGTLTYTGTADVRDTTPSNYVGASGEGNVFITSTAGTFFEISGIDTRGYTDLALSLGHHKSTINSNNQLVIEVSSDGVTYTPLSYSRSTGQGTAVWLVIQPTGVIPAVENLRIRFRQTANNVSFRIDDVVLTGIPPARPEIVAPATTNSGESEVDGEVTYQVVRGTSTTVSVSAEDDAGEGNLTYTWAAAGAPVTFSPNGNNAAKTATATFAAAGDYTLTVTVQNGNGFTSTSAVPVRVAQTASGITVAPSSVAVVFGGTQQFTAVQSDQFDDPMTAQPSLDWSVSGGGTISSSGLFTAGLVGGPYTVTAAADGLSGTAQATVTPAAAGVSLGDLFAVYDGTAKVASATTSPPGLAVALTYNGSASPPVNAGSYAVVAVVTDANYTGSATGTLVVARASQTITFAALPAKAFGDEPFVPGASATSGLPITYTSSSPEVATVNAGSINITGVGITTITASQAGNSNYEAAASVEQLLAVHPGVATVTLSGLSRAFDGQPKEVSVTTVPAGLAVTVTYDGSPTPPAEPGSYAVEATVNEANYTGSATGTLVIDESVLTFSQWIETFAGLADKTPAGDPDGDGLSNLMEYFMGSNPGVPDAAGAFRQSASASAAHLTYRRDKRTVDVEGHVLWSTDPNGEWSASGVTNVVVEDHENYEIRRASVAWPDLHQAIFLRLDLVTGGE